MKKSEDFSEWYNDVIDRAGLCDKRYPVKGMNIWTPYGWKLMLLIDRLFREEFDRTGHSEVCFPLLIPEDQFAKEKEHIKGFDEQVYWVTHAGANPLDIKLCLRPTSETAIYPIFKLWVRSHADLPLKIYQIVDVFRYETKQTRAFMRVREIHFFESHTCHADFNGAEDQMKQNLEIMERLARKLCLPYIAAIRPEWDKFAGAHYSIGIDSAMPSGRTLQIGGIHQYKDNFAKPFEITYEDEKGNQSHVHQTTFGMSERLVGAIVAIHGDDGGVMLPPAVAPFQVVIVPVLAKGQQEKIEEECGKVRDELAAAGLRVHLDSRDMRPGNKYYDWELKGVPLRIELGKKDMDEDAVMAVRRDNREKSKLPRKELAAKVENILLAIETDLYRRADAEMNGKIGEIGSLAELKNISGILRVHWCGLEECGRKIEQEADASLLGTPVPERNEKSKCIACGKESEKVALVARTY